MGRRLKPRLQVQGRPAPAPSSGNDPKLFRRLRHFVLHKGAVDEDFGDADGPELLNQDCEIVDQPRPPSRVPMGVAYAWPDDEQGLPQLCKREFVVARRQQTVAIDRAGALLVPWARTGGATKQVCRT